jgi:large subunit ribosomal protein L18
MKPRIDHTISLATKRARRVRGRLHGTAERPRVSVSRSNHYTYLQAIDDVAQVTLAAERDDMAQVGKQTKTARAKESALRLAKTLQSKKISAAVLDRGSYRYHGRVKVVAEGLREAGIQV